MPIIDVEQQSTATPKPAFNFMHFKTPHGILLLVEFVTAIIMLVLWPPLWMSIIGWLACIVTLFLIVIYLFSIQDRYTGNPPVKVMEFYFNVGTCLLYALCTLLNFILFAWLTGIFSVINTLAYAVSAFLLLSNWNKFRNSASRPVTVMT